MVEINIGNGHHLRWQAAKLCPDTCSVQQAPKIVIPSFLLTVNPWPEEPPRQRVDGLDVVALNVAELYGPAFL